MVKSSEGGHFPDIYFDTHEIPKLEPPTRLYGLEAIGIGTGRCESLKSYISRLANEHRVSTRVFMKETIVKELGVYQSYCSSGFFWNKSTRDGRLITGEMVEHLLAMLSKATGVRDLAYCTMHPVNQILSLIGLVSPGERHCMLCLSEVNGNVPQHEQLIWNIACVTTCPIHKINLSTSQCSAPKNKYLSLSRRKFLSGVCSTCGSIGYGCNVDPPSKSSEVDFWKAQQVAELIASFPCAFQMFSKQNTIEGLNSLTSMFSDGKPAVVARRAGIYKSVLWGWLKGKHLPSLELLLELCLSTGVSLVSLMQGHPVECIHPKQETTQDKKQYNKIGKDVRELALKGAIITDPTPSLSEMAKRLGLDRSTLRRQFPTLTSMIIERSNKYRSKEIAERHKKLRTTAWRIAKKLSQKNLPLTHRNFQAEYGKAMMPMSYIYKRVMTTLAP